LQSHAWWALFTSLERQGRFDEARATLRAAGKAFPSAEARVLEQLVAIRAGEFARADGALGEISVGAEPKWRAEALWWLTVSLRMQGRFREALVVADQYRPVADSLYLEPGRPNPGHGVARAVVLLESGRAAEAAHIFDSISRGPAGPTRTANARNRTWFLTHAASALYAAGDTAALRAMVERVSASGRESGFGRDRLLHHYVGGLLLAARGALPEAVDEFRQNGLSYMYGWAVYRESESLLALGRPREAIPPLRRVLRRSLETGNFYLNLTSVRELLGDAYAAVGEPDSAAQQYRWVAAAWRRADTALARRVAALRAKLSAAERHAAALATQAR
jgi:tetratricopeptide (TPR) repeat protein